MWHLNKIILFVWGAGAALAAYGETQSELLSVPSPGIHRVQQAKFIKPLAATQRLTFNVWLKLRNKGQLDQLVQDIYNPQSPRYHQFLTAAHYEQDFAPESHAEQVVLEFFKAQGLNAQLVNHHVRVKATVAQIEQTLHVRMQQYRSFQHTAYANNTYPQLPPQVAMHIAEITGLNNWSAYPGASGDEATPEKKNPQNLNFMWQNFKPEAIPTDISLQGFSGANLQKVYNLQNIPRINGVRLDGAGQTLVIVDKCGSNGPAQILSDANKYFQANGIKPFIVSGPLKNFAIINPDGTPFTQCPNPSSFSQEILLDIESSHTLAPGANTVLVLGSDQQPVLMDVIETLIQNNYTLGGFPNAYVISNSWGGEESLDVALESSLELAAAAGISVNFSSGDCGDNTYTNDKKCTGNPMSPRTVNYPASSAYVTAVGATSLFVDNNYRYAFETVWGTVKTLHSTLAYDGGTGGGISQIYGPVTWQNSISNFTAGGYGVISNFGQRRALPDVAMLGDPQTGLLIIADGAQVKDGGTSLACPLFAATLTLVNQARNLLNKGTPIGQAAPYLYQMNEILLINRALRLIIPPAVIISGANPPPPVSIQGTPAPASAFTLGTVTFGWDSGLTIEPEAQYWNDGVGVGSPNIPNFVISMANM